MNSDDDFLGDGEAPKITPEQAALTRRQEQKSSKYEKLTKDLTTLSQSFPQAYMILKEYIEFEIYTLETIMANANDSDILLKYSGMMKILKEIHEKLEVYKDFS